MVECVQEVVVLQDGNPGSHCSFPGRWLHAALLALLPPAQASEHLPGLDRQLDLQRKEKRVKVLG